MSKRNKQTAEVFEKIFALQQEATSKRHKLSDAFLRPPYQYTSIEVMDPGWMAVRQGQFDRCF